MVLQPSLSCPLEIVIDLENRCVEASFTRSRRPPHSRFEHARLLLFPCAHFNLLQLHDGLELGGTLLLVCRRLLFSPVLALRCPRGRQIEAGKSPKTCAGAERGGGAEDWGR
jgi:hypothetical protein